MVNEYNWKLGLTFDNKEYLFEWYEYIHEGKSFGYCKNVTVVGEEDQPRNSTEVELVVTAAEALRTAQVRNEIKADFIFEKEEIKEAILRYFDRASKGEYLGQPTGGLLYVGNIADILSFPVGYVRDFVEDLIEDKRIGLNGDILIPYKDYMETFKYWFDKTGHKRLTVSDFGGWYCTECGQVGSGDESETSDPKKFPCIKPDVDLIF